MSHTLKEIQEDVEKFCKERNWNNSDPNQLITSIIIELGELSEHYQWKNKFPEFTEDEKTEIGFEFVDVIFYLARLANNSGIDLEEYFYKKLPKLEKKFPTNIGNDTSKVHKLYRDTGMNKRYE